MRRYDLQPTPEHPREVRVEVHVLGCECTDCEPYRPSLPPRLGFHAIGRIALAALLVGHLAAAALWGPRTVAHVLCADVTGARP